nr:unnamed protein product [Spirometra erinaceieuropaei]
MKFLDVQLFCSTQKLSGVEISAFIEISPNFRGGLTQRPLCARSLTLRAIRLLLWLFVWETILHIVYPNAVLFLATQPAAGVPPPPPPPPALGSSVSGRFHASPHLETDRSALGGAVYLIGLQFFFAYMQLYGWPRLLSDVQVYLMARSHSPVASNVFTCLVPDGPPCPTHVFLFSEMWRKFDRGLYNFLKWYIYLPWLKPTERTVRKKTVSLAIPPHHPVSLVQRLQGGILCFLFVLIFHSCNSQNAVWVGINTIQILLERFFKWTYHNTIYGEKLRDSLSDASLRRITGILCSISAIFSSIGFFYFYLGFTSGQWIGYWMLVDPVYRVIAIVCYYCTYQISLAAERWYTSK